MLIGLDVDAFAGEHVLDNFIRLFIVIVGMISALVCFKMVVTAVMQHRIEAAWRSLAFGLIVVSPAVRGLFRFGEPLLWYSTILYVAGLLAAVVSLAYRVTLSLPWMRRRPRGKP